MKLNNYPLTIILAFGLFAIGCESVRRDSLNEARSKQAEHVAADTAKLNFFKRNLTAAQVDSVWRVNGY